MLEGYLASYFAFNAKHDVYSARFLNTWPTTKLTILRWGVQWLTQNYSSFDNTNTNYMNYHCANVKSKAFG